MLLSKQHLSQAYNKLRGFPENQEVDYASEEETQATLCQMTPTSLKQTIDTDPAKLLHLLASLCHSSEVRNKKLRDSNDDDYQEIPSQTKYQWQTEEQRKEVESYRAETLSLKIQVEKLQHLADQKTSPEFFHPPMYDGNRDDFEVFQYKLAAKLDANADWFPTEKIALGYCFTRLTGKAQKRMLPRLSRNGIWNVQTVKQFQRALTIDFEDPNKKWTARRYIERLQQGDNSFPDYLSDFHTYIGDAELGDVG